MEEAVRVVVLDTLNTSKGKSAAGGKKKKDQEAMLRAIGVRHWQSMTDPCCFGRYVPDTESEAQRRRSLAGMKFTSYEDWLRKTR